MMKRLWVGILVIVLMVGGFSASAQDDDGLEIPILDDGDQIRDEFEDPVFARLYAFAGTEGDVVTVSMFAGNDSDTDPYLVLLGASGEVLMTNDDFGGGSSDAMIEEFELPESGTYFVLATMWESRLDQAILEDEDDKDYSYGLSIVGINPPSDLDNAFEMLRGEVPIGASGTLEISEDEAVFFVIFVGDEGQIITLDAQSDDIDTLLYLFDAEGDRLAINDDREPGNLNAAIEDYELPDDGYYLVFVMPFNFYDAYLEDIIDTGSVDFRID